ncbi:MAG: hypothetical protein ACYTFA_12420 [Planctomycetota bacterium]|jgi:hypothetical protein
MQDLCQGGILKNPEECRTDPEMGGYAMFTMPHAKEERTVNATITPDADALLNQIVADFKMHKKHAFGRLLIWFTEQEPMVQSLVLGYVPDDYAGDVIELIYEKRVKEAEATAHGHDVVRRAREKAPPPKPQRKRDQRKRGA